MSEGVDEEFSIHWIEDVVQEILEREFDDYLISTGKSPSGSIHIGIMRELIVADVIKRELLRLKKDTRSMFVVDDYDPLRSLPQSVTLSLSEWAGVPYSDVPDEFGCCESFGAHWANELIETFPEFGIDPDIVWTSKLYETDKMLDAVRVCLKKTETIREIMKEYVAKDFNAEQKKQYLKGMESWYPASVICPECGKFQSGAKGEIVPNRVKDYDADSDTISFECPECGHQARLPLSDVRIKLTWRVDWPAKWYVLNVSCEPAGKDHSVKGGSYDTGLEVSRRVFDWEGPVKVPYEWVRISGRDMSTSEGIVFTPKTWLQIAPPELYRFIMLKTDLARAVNIRPEAIPDMIDEFERFERVYYGLDDADDETQALAQIVYPLAMTGPVSEEYIPKLPFKFAVVMSQLEDLLGMDTIVERSEEALKQQYALQTVPNVAKKRIPVRLRRARKWVEMFGSKGDLIQVPEEIPKQVLDTLTPEDATYLHEILNLLQEGPLQDEEIQTGVFETANELDFKVRRAFTVLYRVLISRKSGPRLGPFINMLGREWVIERIQKALRSK